MTTAYLTVTMDVSIETAIARRKAEAPNLDIVDYVYVVDEEETLQGEWVTPLSLGDMGSIFRGSTRPVRTRR